MACARGWGRNQYEDTLVDLLDRRHQIVEVGLNTATQIYVARVVRQVGDGLGPIDHAEVTQRFGQLEVERAATCPCCREDRG